MLFILQKYFPLGCFRSIKAQSLSISSLNSHLFKEISPTFNARTAFRQVLLYFLKPVEHCHHRIV
jgi:hypothetical protein